MRKHSASNEKSLWQVFLAVFTALTMLSATPRHESDESFTATPIPDSVFQRMDGKSYQQNPHISREDLRYLRVLHFDAEGNVCQGEMICNKAIAEDLLDIFRELYRHRYPIQRMRLIDDYDADDEQSMRDNNSSCFCFRQIAGSQKLSKHALGLAVDINPLYNPYCRVKDDGIRIVRPSTAEEYCDRRKKFPYKINKRDLCYRLFLRHGFQWGGSWKSLKDYQHFEK